MLSENLVKAFNAQINAEMWSSNLYLSMSVYFAQNGYDGMASWMRAQSKEELDHAYEMIDFVIKRNGNVEIGQINVKIKPRRFFLFFYRSERKKCKSKSNKKQIAPVLWICLDWK